MLRVVLGSFFLIAGVALVFAAYLFNLDERRGGLVQDFGVECIGVTITVLVVDWLFEWRQAGEEARKMAWRALDVIHHAVWVWQGGSRELDLYQLASVLRAVTDKDPLPPFTQILILQIGSNSINTLHLDEKVVSTSRNLRAALGSLKPLAKIHDSPTLLPPRQIATYLRESAARLARVVGSQLPDGEAAFADKFRDPSIGAQEWRHKGTTPAKGEAAKL